MYKPYWSNDLQCAWDSVCQKEQLWLRWRRGHGEKRKLRDSLNRQRKIFDKLNRSAKRKYQMAERDRPKHKFSDHDTRNFWKYIGKIGLQNDRKSSIMEVVDDNGNLTTNIDEVLLRWKNDYENLFHDNDDNGFDENHLRNVKNALQNDMVQRNDVDLSALNADITREEVEKSIMRAKLRKAAGLDDIPAEVLRNPVCVDLLHKIITFCFHSGTVSCEWNTELIKPIPKGDGKDPRDPLSYRGIPYNIYADIITKHQIVQSD